MNRLDVERLRKCAALMQRGATPGERAAGEAAAKRVAAAVGLTLADALRLDDGAARPQEASVEPPRRPSPKRPDPKPAMQAGPITLEELLAQKARHQAWLKRKAAREEKRLRKAYAEQEAENAYLRAQQAQRDREWAKARGKS